MDDTRRDIILSHVDKIEQFARQPGNEWLLSNLQQRFSDGGKIEDIYEYCIENIIKEQAMGFYQEFPLKPIVPQLVQDFVKMEHFRRKNNFDEFSLSVFQQIECITNSICRNARFDLVVSRLMGHSAYISSVQNTNGTWSSPTLKSRTGSFQIAQLLFGRDYASEKSRSSAQAYSGIDKVRLVLYFICYEAKLLSSAYGTFIEHKNILDDIYQFRNRNHRGSVPMEWQQSIYDRINAQQGMYYVKFMQFLCFFVESVTKGIASFDELYNYAIEQSSIDVKPSLKVVGKIDLNNIPKR